jgi:hypothetical protein
MNSVMDVKDGLSNKLFEFLIAFSLSLIYFYGITLLARTTVLFEIFLCLIIPALVFYINKYSKNGTAARVMQLIIIETLYMLFVILSKISIYFNAAAINHLINSGFFSLFIIQFMFFMLYQFKVKSYFGFLRTFMFLVLVFYWFHDVHLNSIIDAQGRFLMWGTEAPTYIILYYCFWVIGIPLVDSRTLPNFLSALFHFASVSIAVWSQEFFHVRLLTASHLFILDALFHFSDKNKENLFCVISTNQFEFYQKHIRKKIDYFILIGCMSIFMLHILNR